MTLYEVVTKGLLNIKWIRNMSPSLRMLEELRMESAKFNKKLEGNDVELLYTQPIYKWSGDGEVLQEPSEEPHNFVQHRERLDEIHDIYKEKNEKYGSSFDKSLDRFGFVAWQVRNSDKINRLETLLGESLKQDSNGKWYLEDGLEGSNESIHDTLMDAAGYIILLDMWLSNLNGGDAESTTVYADNQEYKVIVSQIGKRVNNMRKGWGY